MLNDDDALLMQVKVRILGVSGEAHARLPEPPVCSTMPLVMDAVWAVWGIGSGIYDYFHTSAMEDRIHRLEKVLSIHQFAIAGLSAGLIILVTYILWRKH